ncbi:MAG: tRNA (adenosine(37)-N6)-threonylcarbamoyltransferase complex ATPase subunit type 1 TsaE [Candidatus Parcubacteria bacterium]|nr:MAG: tRNA (adenosine(37)-N6)-threonylcarbamoyltransferase complex ATPase subunit type 1 TsaE [Candidatus Parcubacteria bacterium]
MSDALGKPLLQKSGIEETAWREIARELLEVFPSVSVFALSGPLGAGKTSFVRGAVAALGGEDSAVQSPTFVLERRYPVVHPAWREVSHWDWYRLSEEEVAKLPFWSSASSQAVCSFVEWPERALFEWRAAPRPFVWLVFSEEGEGAARRSLSVYDSIPPHLLPADAV